MPREDFLNLTEDSRKDVAVDLSECIRQAESDRADLLARVASWRRQYAQDMPKAKADWPFVGASEVCLPSTRNAVRATRDRLSRATFSIEPYFLVKNRKRELEQQAAGMERDLHWRASRCLNLKAACDDAFLKVLTDSVAWAVVKYEQRRATIYTRRIQQQAIPVRNDLTGEAIYSNGAPVMDYQQAESIEPIELVTYSGPALSIEAVEDVGIFPASAVRPEQVTGYYRRITKSMGEWRAGEREGTYREVESLESQGAPASALDAQKQKETGVAASSREPLPDSAIRSAWECLWRWKVGGRMQWVIFMVAEGSPTLLQHRKYPYWHQRPFYIPLRANPKSDSFYGWSMPEELRQLQLVENALWRQYLDAGTLANALTLAARRQAGYRWQKFQAAPGKINYFDDPASIQHFAFPGPNPGLLQALGINAHYIEQTSSISDLALGVIPGQEVKATEVNAAASGSNVTFEQMLHRLQNGSGEIGVAEGLNEVARQVLALDYQFIGGTDIPVKEFGFDPFQGVDLGELLFGYDLTAAGSTSVENKEIEKQSRMAFVNWFSSHPMFAPLAARFKDGPYQMAAYVAEAYDNLPTVEKWIGTKEEAAAALQAEQMQQQQMQMQAMQMQQQQMQFEQGTKGTELELAQQEAERKELETVLNARAKGEDIRARMAIAEESANKRREKQE